jgi:hypothetical protein
MPYLVAFAGCVGLKSVTFFGGQIPVRRFKTQVLLVRSLGQNHEKLGNDVRFLKHGCLQDTQDAQESRRFCIWILVVSGETDAS